MGEKNINLEEEINSNELLEQVKTEDAATEKEKGGNTLVAVIITAIIGCAVAAATTIAGYKLGYKKASNECLEQISKLRSDLGLPEADDSDE